MTKHATTFRKIDVLILFVICLLALSLRLYKISTPLADWHSWRQADTSAVSRNFIKDGFDVLKPTYDDLSNIQTGQYNPEGLRMVEFPLYNALVAGVYRIAPILPLEQVGRLVTAIMSLVLISVLYYLVLKEHSRMAAIASSGIYSVFPFFVYYSRVVLPETTALAFMFLGIFSMYIWTNAKGKAAQIVGLTAAVVSGALALLVKPTVAFYLLVYACLFLRRYGWSAFKRPLTYVSATLVCAPLFAWRVWISQFPVGIPAYQWLITTVQTFEGPKEIFMRPAFFRWIFYERILLLIMGGWAASFLMFGALLRIKRSRIVLVCTGVSAIIYLLVFQGGNVQHDYYQTVILPALAIFAGLGIAFIFENDNAFHNRIISGAAVLAILVFSWLMSYESVKGYYGYSENLVNTADIIQTITPEDALIITDTTGDTTLLYNAHRRGIPATTDTLPNLKERGMQYFVTYSTENRDKVLEEFPEYELIFKNESVYIFKL